MMDNNFGAIPPSYLKNKTDVLLLRVKSSTQQHLTGTKLDALDIPNGSKGQPFHVRGRKLVWHLATLSRESPPFGWFTNFLLIPECLWREKRSVLKRYFRAWMIFF